MTTDETPSSKSDWSRVTTPCVHQGDRVRFWSVETGLQPQMGTVCSSKVLFSATFAIIQPDNAPEKRYHLFHRAVWGFEPIEEGNP